MAKILVNSTIGWTCYFDKANFIVAKLFSASIAEAYSRIAAVFSNVVSISNHFQKASIQKEK